MVLTARSESTAASMNSAKSSLDFMYLATLAAGVAESNDSVMVGRIGAYPGGVLTDRAGDSHELLAFATSALSLQPVGQVDGRGGGPLKGGLGLLRLGELQPTG